MKMCEALDIILNKKENKGYMVSFEKVKGCMLLAEHFPDKHAGEPLIETEERAWKLARMFADATWGECVNIYVMDHNFHPVPGYQFHKIENRK